MISYIVPAFNSEKTIEECINSILLQDNKKEIIVIDNGSRDDTIRILNRLSKKHPEIKILTERKRGPAAARNRGLEAAKGDYIVFVDSDVILPQGWAKKAMEKLKNNADVIGVGGPARNASKGTIAELFDPLFLYYMTGAESYVTSLATMNAMFKGNFIKNERFDEDLVTSEDPELSFRLRRKGHKLLVSKELEVMHNHPTGFRDVIRRWFYYGKNYHIPYLKYPENISPIFIFKVAYLPVLILLAVFAYINIRMLFLPAVMIFGVFAMYAYIGWKRIKKPKLRVLFPFLHLLKFHIHSIGSLYGLVYHFIKRIKESGTKMLLLSLI